MPPTVNHNSIIPSPTFPSMTTAPSVVFTGMMQCAPGIAIPGQPTAAAPPGTYYSTSPTGATYVFEQASQPTGRWVVPVSCGDQGGRMMIAPGQMVAAYYHQSPPIPLQPSPPQTALMAPQQVPHTSLSMVAYAPAQTSFPIQQATNISIPLPTLTNSANMQVVWHSIFDQLFSTFLQINHQWQLFPSMEAPSTGHFEVIKDSAKVRFLCQDCGNAWTSMKGRIVFWTTIDVATGCGVVFFKLFGQQCEKCSSGKFEHAMWYPEEVNKVVRNVFQRVGELYYGFPKAQILNDRRPGKPRTQHNSKLCQACADNVCTEGGTIEAKLSPGIFK